MKRVHPTQKQAAGTHTIGGRHPFKGHAHEITAKKAVINGPPAIQTPNHAGTDYHVYTPPMKGPC